MEPVQNKRLKTLSLKPTQGSKAGDKKAAEAEESLVIVDEFQLRPEVKRESSKPSASDTKTPAELSISSEGPPQQPLTVEKKPSSLSSVLTQELDLPAVVSSELSAAPKQTLAQAAALASKGATAKTSKVTAPGSNQPLSVETSQPTAGARRGLLTRIGHGIMSFLTSDPVAPFQADLKKINKLEKAAQALQTPAQFQAKTQEFKTRLAKGESLADIRTEAYAVARQATRVATGLRPYDCQVLGALAMDDGHIAEMRTGEGKTLTAVMPMYLNALAGKGAHLVTVNDTLAARDAEEMGPAYELLGMSVGTVLEGMNSEQKRAGYSADITYTTDRTLGFDFLRDRTAKSVENRVQREPFFALIDEVDEVLIDEARTPLIISGQGESAAEEFSTFNKIAETLVVGDDYYIDQKKNSVWLSETGMAWVENELSKNEIHEKLKTSSPDQAEQLKSDLQECDELGQHIRSEQAAYAKLNAFKKQKPSLVKRMFGAEWDEEKLETLENEHSASQKKRLEKTSETPGYELFHPEHQHRYRFMIASLKAHAMFENDEDYMVADGEVQIVDENKGRTSDGRRYNDGIHQALEAKEGVEINPEQKTIASITYPKLFERYPRLSGMSGTAKTSENEFLELYELDVIQVPTNKPVIRDDQDDIIFATLEEKFAALAKDTAADYFAGRPVLVGTLSVEHNEYMAQQLIKAGVPAESIQVLNAETVRGNREEENRMISNAGRSGVVTVATNLAGRGANIKPDLVNFRALTERVYAAKDQGKPVVITLEKESQAKWMAQWLDGLDTQIVKNDHRDFPSSDGPIQIRVKRDSGPVPSDVQPSNTTASFDAEDYPTGGLTVYGSQRANSPRIDNQLIGRAGRQGAPGRSRFYLSLEDDLLRVHGKKLDGVLSMLTKPGAGISHPLVKTMVSGAQSQVESTHVENRESTNKQDEVLDLHRQVFYGFRDEVLEDGPIRDEKLENMLAKSINRAVLAELPKKKKFSYEQIAGAVKAAKEKLHVPIDLAFLKPDGEVQPDKTMKAKDLTLELDDFANRSMSKTLKGLKQHLPNSEATIRSLVLDSVDDSWSVHLDEMELLKKSVQWQSIAQKDPEVQFKLQAFDVLGDTIARMEDDFTSNLLPDLLSFLELVKKKPVKL